MPHVHSTVIPVWVIDGDVTSTRFIVAVDGSVSSLGATDHLCFMVGENPKIKVTLFHVVPRLRDYCMIDFDEKKVTSSKSSHKVTNDA